VALDANKIGAPIPVEICDGERQSWSHANGRPALASCVLGCRHTQPGQAKFEKEGQKQEAEMRSHSPHSRILAKYQNTNLDGT